ncbi:MAG TPA: FAD-dependent oxidoreductase, partial [Steroidobacteraceae bacterium]
MSSVVELTVPDLGNFENVEVVDVLVKEGDVVEVDTPLITLETDKASMDVPSTAAGTIVEVLLKRGDRVSKGSLIARVETASEGDTVKQKQPQPPADELRPPARPETSGDTVRMPIPDISKVAAAAAAARGESALGAKPEKPASVESEKPERPVPVAPGGERATQLVVLGAGPGGYTAAFRAADLGMQVTLIERWPSLGGVCLNVGCIPSKALLHAAKVIEDAEAMSAHGIHFGTPEIDLEKLRAWKGSVVRKLTGGLKLLAKQRKVDVIQGVGRFVGPNTLEVQGPGGTERIRFEQCIIAAGSEPIRLPGLPEDPRIMDSTDALELPEFSGRMLIVGGGIIGLEMACVYDALGTKVSVVELTPQLMPGCDADLVRPLEKRLRGRYEQILLGTKVSGVEALKEGLRVTFSGDKAPEPQIFERVLVAVGRTPNGRTINAEAAGVNVDARGFI